MNRQLLIFLSAALLISMAGLLTQAKGDGHGADAGWPRPIPCRIQDGSDLFLMMLGDVKTRLAQGVFDPTLDEVRLDDGRVIKNYYRDSLRILFFEPIDKTPFPLPPSGWCSWYYYYQEIDENEILRNAQWVAEHLRDFGAACIQIDDGWQGSGHGMGENRDWTTVDRRFSRGMDSLATSIKRLGLNAGLWLAPQGQSNPAVVKNEPGVFLLKPDGTSASETWEGKYLVDPTTPEAHDYLRKLFVTLSQWGYDYFKIDGQPVVIEEYRKNAALMKASPDQTAALYRGTVQAIRSAIGRNRYLLGCWGIPLDGIGLMNGSRTGGDVVPGWDGFKTALDATMRQYYLHNVVWYCDPDVMLVRSPLTIDQARAWATLQGLTGQALMASDRMMDLPGDRVEIVRRVFPAVDIRPVDLFPSQRDKRIWDLKVNHLSRNYDVVGAFNYDETRPDRLYLSWNALGLPASGPVHVYDFWNREYLGCWEAGMSVTVPPTACRVLTLLPDAGQIQLISTSRHLTQGWVDLIALAFDSAANSYTGKSRVVRNDPYELRFVYPRGRNFTITRAEAGNLPVTITNHQGWSTASFTSSATTEISWHVTFEPAAFYLYPIRGPRDFTLERVGLDGVNLQWSPQYYLSAGYQTYLDGELLGFSPDNAFALRQLNPERKYRAEVRTVWEDGRVSKEKAEVQFTLASMIPQEIYVSELDPVRSTTGWGSIEKDRGVARQQLSVGGRKFQRGIGTHARSEIVYDLHGLFNWFTFSVGVDDGNGSEKGSVEFTVLGSGKELWRSGVMKKGDGAKSGRLDIGGVQELLLRVTDAGDGIDYDHADWMEAKVIRR